MAKREGIDWSKAQKDAEREDNLGKPPKLSAPKPIPSDESAWPDANEHPMMGEVGPIYTHATSTEQMEEPDWTRRKRDKGSDGDEAQVFGPFAPVQQQNQQQNQPQQQNLNELAQGAARLRLVGDDGEPVRVMEGQQALDQMSIHQKLDSIMHMLTEIMDGQTWR